jgi:predicted ABC-type exoprotein transport system permease subunit
MKTIETLRKAASYLVSLGGITLLLTVAQPMHPEVDKMFRIGAVVAIVLCLGLLLALKAIEGRIRKPR